MTVADLPDNYPWFPGSKRFVIADMAELAARLGSPVTYDRRGQVVWLDSGAFGLGPWVTTVDGTGAAVKVAVGALDASGYALELTAGSDAGASAQVFHRLGVLEAGRFGMEVAVSFVQAGNVCRFELLHYDGATESAARVQIDNLANELLIYGEGEGWVKIADLAGLGYQYGTYRSCKVVGDLETGYYVRLLFDDEEYDVSSHLLSAGPSAQAPTVEIQVNNLGRAGENDVLLVGRVILTVGEP